MSTSNTVVPGEVRPEALPVVSEGNPPPPSAPVAPILPQKAKVASGFLTTATDALLIVLVGQILEAMQGNAHYPAPAPALADIQAALAAFVAAVNGGRGGALQVARRRQLRAALVALVRSLGLHVQQAGKGERVLLLTSGFPLQRQRTPNGRPAVPSRLRVKCGAVSGVVSARCDRVATAGAYQWRYAPTAAPTAWTFAVPTLGASITIAGIQRGTEVVVQVRAIGHRGASDWSDGGVLLVA